METMKNPKEKAKKVLLEKARYIIECRLAEERSAKERDYEMAQYWRKRAERHAHEAYWFVQGFVLADSYCLCSNSGPLELCHLAT